MYKYARYRYDSETGLYRPDPTAGRCYGPATGNWNGRDPWGFAAGDAALHRYVANSPANARDPSGLDSDNLLQEGLEIGVAAALRRDAAQIVANLFAKDLESALKPNLQKSLDLPLNALWLGGIKECATLSLNAVVRASINNLEGNSAVLWDNTAIRLWFLERRINVTAILLAERLQPVTVTVLSAIFQQSAMSDRHEALFWQGGGEA